MTSAYKMLPVLLICCLETQFAFGSENADAEPITRVPPEVPLTAMQSGNCFMRFDINPDGEPDDIRIDTCTDSLFEESAIAAVEKWTFSPKIVDGKPVVTRNVENRLSFKITDFDDNIIAEPRDVEYTVGDDREGMLEAAPVYLHPGDTEQLAGRNVKGYCCASFSISQLGYPFNVNMDSCSESKFEKTADQTVRWSEYRPTFLSSRAVSSDGHSEVVKFTKVSKYWRWRYESDENGYSAYIGSEDDYNQLCRQIS